MVARILVLLAVSGIAAGAGLSLRRYFRNAAIPASFDRKDVEMSQPGAMLVEFTSPYCHECQVAYPRLQAASKANEAPLAVIDTRQRPDLTAKYSIRTTPTILVVDGQGKVTGGWLNASPSEDEVHAALRFALRA